MVNPSPISRCIPTWARPDPDLLSSHPDLAADFEKLKSDLAAPAPDLEKLGRNSDSFTQGLLDAFSDLEPVLAVISHFNDQITETLIQNRCREMEARGMGRPPRPFCWISMGSDARREQVVRTDQDNALIYGDTDPLEAMGKAPARGMTPDEWFEKLAQGVTRDLAAYGFALCKGEVMAVNPVWRRSLGEWTKALDQWVGSSDPMAIRKLTILLDFRGVWGETDLADALHAHVFDRFKSNPVVNHFLVRDDSLFATPRTFFGRLRTRRLPNGKRGFNIKTMGLAHLINAVRILAVNSEISTPSTLERLSALEVLGRITPGEHQEYKTAFLFLARMKIRNHLGRDPGLPSNQVVVSGLPPDKRRALDSALDTVTALQKRIQKNHNQAWMNFFN